MSIAVLAGVTIHQFAVSEALTQAGTALVLLAAGLLVYRAFREPYLLAWNCGWVAYVGYKLAMEAVALEPQPRLWLALTDAAYLLAVTLFASAVFLYTNYRRLTVPLAIAALLLLDAAIVHAVWWPQSYVFRQVLRASYMLITIGAASHLMWFTRGRRMLGPWLLAVALLPVHIHEVAANAHANFGLDVAVELGLGLSMLLTVLDDEQLRVRRLRAVNAIATAVSEARELGPMLRSVLEELRGVIDANAAWFRLLEGDRLLLLDSVGLSDDYVRGQRDLPLGGSFSGRVIRARAAGLIRTADADEATRTRLQRDGFSYVLVVPVRGKTAVVGTVALGCSRSRSYTPGEMRFLSASVNQLGMALENLRMFEQMVQSQRQWVSTFDSIEDAIFVHADDGRILRANRALLARLSRPYSEVVGRTCEEVLPRTREWLICPYCSDAYSVTDSADPCFGGYSLVSSSRYSEGSERRGTVHVLRDITDRRAAEERYLTLFQQVQEGVFISTPEGRIVDCNDAFVRMLGYDTREQVMALDIARDMYADPAQRQQHLLQLSDQNGVRDLEFMLRRRNGSRITVQETSFPTRDASGNVIRYQGFILDVTQKKRGEEEIRRRNRELYALNAIAVVGTQSLDLDEILAVTLRHVADLFSADIASIYTFDESTKQLRRRAAMGHIASPAMQASTLSLDDAFWSMVRASHTEVITGQHLPHLPSSIADLIAAEQLQAWVWVVMWAKDKVAGLIAVSSRSPREFTSTDENLMVAIARQLATTIDKVRLYEETTRAYDDLRRTQEQLLQSEKMSAVGQLISGVAHELNNPLTAILGYAQLLESEDTNDRVRDFLQKLYKQAQRTHRIVQNLLSFARQRKPEKQAVDVRRVLEDTLALRDYDLKLNNILVERDFQPMLPPVVADAHQLEQVFLNIINNSVDAMLEVARGGALRVRIWGEHGHVSVAVHDSGPGIRDPKRVFDPFYTTKGIGKGTGLGLSICYGIVKEHGGEITARNHPSGGAVFQVSLPVAPQAEAITPPSRVTKQTALLRGRILVVDDEEAVLDFEKEVLIGAGAEVVAAPNGERALAQLKVDSFDALIVDGKMPGGWTGIDIYRWLMENRPGMEKHIVMALSDLNDPTMRHFIESSGVMCIVKPFDVADLISIVSRVLRKRREVAAQ